MNFILFQLTQKIFRIVSSVIDKIIIENDVQMNMVGIGMDCKEILILSFEKFFT